MLDEVDKDVAAVLGFTSSSWFTHIPLFSCATHEAMHKRVRAIVRGAAQLSERTFWADEAPSISKISAKSSAVSEGSSRSSERSSRSWRPSPSGIGTKVLRAEIALPPPVIGKASSRYCKRLRSGVEGWKVPGFFPGLVRGAFLFLSPSAANCISAARGLELRASAGPDFRGEGESAFMVIYEAKVACTCVTLG